MGYFEYLKGLLRPMGLYELESGAGAAELEAIGGELDGIFAALEELGGEMLPFTAEDYGIALYEGLLPYRPAYITAKDARRALMALLRIRGGCFTLPQLQDTLSGCGLTARVRESGQPLTVIVSFPQNRGIPEGFAKLKRRVEEIIPCHLAVEYEFIYTLWSELMAAFCCWEDCQTRGISWYGMEIFLEQEDE